MTVSPPPLIAAERGADQPAHTPSAAPRQPHADAIAYPPRGLSREEAARYIGVGTTKFDELVLQKRMPAPKQIDSRVVWDRVALDMAFTALPEKDTTNFFDQKFS